MGLGNEQQSSRERMEIVSRIKEISYDLERTAPGTEEYQKELLAIVGRINTWTEDDTTESGERIEALRREILWLLNDMKTGKGRNEEAIPDMRQHVVETLESLIQFLGNPKAEGGGDGASHRF